MSSGRGLAGGQPGLDRLTDDQVCRDMCGYFLVPGVAFRFVHQDARGETDHTEAFFD